MNDHELLEAILEASVGVKYETGMTSAEIREETQLSKEVVKRRLKKLLDDGVIEAVYVYRPALHYSLTGMMVKVPGYRRKSE